MSTGENILVIALLKIKQRKCECYLCGDSSCCHWKDQDDADKALTEWEKYNEA